MSPLIIIGGIIMAVNYYVYKKNNEKRKIDTEFLQYCKYCRIINKMDDNITFDEKKTFIIKC